MASPKAVSGTITTLKGFMASEAAFVCGSTSQTLARAFGPCTATRAMAFALSVRPSRRGVMVRPLFVASFCWRIQATSFSAVPAFTTRRNQSSRKK